VPVVTGSGDFTVRARDSTVAPLADHASTGHCSPHTTEFAYVIGSRILHYEILGKLGEGGMGVVYRARDLKLGRDVALKLLPQELVGDPERRRRFDLEARAVATLKHPNIITVYSVEEAEGSCFITMEYIEGSTLSSEIANGGMPAGTIVDVAIDLSDALANPHAKGNVHRARKPADATR